MHMDAHTYTRAHTHFNMTFSIRVTAIIYVLCFSIFLYFFFTPQKYPTVKRALLPAEGQLCAAPGFRNLHRVL